MCIAIYKPAGKVVTKETLAACFQNNSDGAGFAYVNTDLFGKRKIVIKKAMTFDEFYKKYKRAIGIATESDFLIHFRIGTHGIKTTHNVHPFMIDHNTCFMHNGIINKVSKDPKDSDTRMFNKEVLSKLPKGWMFNQGITALLTDYLASSKIVAMDVDGNASIYGEKAGYWVDGCWYSNKSYEVRPYYYPARLPAATPRRADYVDSTIKVWTQETCEYCVDTDMIRKMFPYNLNGQIVLLCKACKKDLLQTSQISEKDAITVTEYLNYRNSFGSPVEVDDYRDNWTC